MENIVGILRGVKETTDIVYDLFFGERRAIAVEKAKKWIMERTKLAQLSLYASCFLLGQKQPSVGPR